MDSEDFRRAYTRFENMSTVTEAAEEISKSSTPLILYFVCVVFVFIGVLDDGRCIRVFGVVRVWCGSFKIQAQTTILSARALKCTIRRRSKTVVAYRTTKPTARPSSVALHSIQRRRKWEMVTRRTQRGETWLGIGQSKNTFYNPDSKQIRQVNVQVKSQVVDLKYPCNVTQYVPVAVATGERGKNFYQHNNTRRLFVFPTPCGDDLENPIDGATKKINVRTMSQGTAPVIGFIDIDSFECQLWQRDFPYFWNYPCVVTNKSGRILSVSYEAKQLGVSRASTPFIKEARRVCPTLHEFVKPNVWGKPDSIKTRCGTWEVLDCIKEYCQRFADDIIIQMASSDEFYLDISSEITRRMNTKFTQQNMFVHIPWNTVHESNNGSRHGPFRYKLKRGVPSNADYWKQVQLDEDRLVLGSVFMSNLCNYVYKKTDLSASAGVGNNKLLAKVGCGINRPRKVTIFHSGAFVKMSPLISIKNIPGLGSLAGEKLMAAFNITQVSELRKICLSELEAHCEANSDRDPPDVELAKKIFSCARGNDDQPVYERLMKTGIICNKPCRDVEKMDQLRRVVWNLSCEILHRLEEEKYRHKRTTPQVRFGFTLENEDGVNTLFEVTPRTKPGDLSKQGMKFIENQPNFDRSNFKIVDLKYSVHDFEPMNSTDALAHALRKMLILGPKNFLPVNCKPHQVGSDLQFTNRNHIGTFRSSGDEKHTISNVQLPKLVPVEQLNELKGFNLEAGYESNPARLFDYSSYNELKHRAFIQWLQEVKFMEKVKTGQFKKPDFIGFSGRFASPMRSPAVKQFGDWEIYASKIEGIIYLWEERKARFEDMRQTYYGTNFEKLAVVESDSNANPCSEYEMAYVVNEMTLGEHQMLVVSNVDAVDSNGDWVEISTWKKSHANALFAKTLRVWAQCCVHGVQKLVLGTRNHEGILEDIQIKSTEDLANSLGEDTAKCMHFENRLLSYIKAHLPESNSKIVKKFSWTCGNRNVVCGQIQQEGIANLMLSRLYSSYLNDIVRKANKA